jgi:hypothetical protein
MDKNLIFKIAENLTNEVGLVPHVNEGGCGAVAVQLFHSLVAKGETPRLVKVAPGWTHLVVEVGGVFLDANGIYGMDEHEALSNAREQYYYDSWFEDEDVKAVEDALRDRGSWNPKFDRGMVDEVMLLVEECVDEAYAHAQA